MIYIRKYQELGKLDKNTIRSLVDSNCKRKLYFQLGNKDPRWMHAETPVYIRAREVDDKDDIKVFGQRYENEVYKALAKSMKEQVRYSLLSEEPFEITAKALQPKDFLKLHQELKGKTAPLILLEHSWELLSSFVYQIFGIPESEDMPTINNMDKNSARPDILLLGNHETDVNGVKEILSDGKLRDIPPSELEERIGISIIDVKNTPSDSIGKKYFSEILFYAFSLRAFLESEGLEKYFFVRAVGNGILGRVDIDALKDAKLAGLFWSSKQDLEKSTSQCLTVPLFWENTVQLFLYFQETVQELWREAQSKTPLKEIDLQLKGSCGSCPFIVDCCQRLSGCAEPDPANEDASEWDIRLLPYLKPTVAEQLRSYGIHQIKDIPAKLDSIHLGTIPTPIHAELPSLKMRADAFLQQKMILASDDHLSLKIPKEMNMSVLFNVEMEQPHNMVFAIGVNWNVEPPPKYHAQLLSHYTDWWKNWISLSKQVKNLSPKHLTREKLKKMFSFLEWKYLKSQVASANEEAEQENEIISMLQQVAESLYFLGSEGGLTLLDTGEEWFFGDGKSLVLERPKINYQYVYVSDGLDAENEYALFSALIQNVYHVLRISFITEELTATFTEKTEKKIKWKKEVEETKIHAKKQHVAGIYWGTEQVGHIQVLVERHLLRLQRDKELYQKYELLVDWITPADSDVMNHKFHQKMYDLQAFLKTAIAFPQVISYTWHGLYSQLFSKMHFDPRFWVQSFNFMDYTVWYEALDTLNQKHRFAKIQTIEEQFMLKMSSMYRIYRHTYISSAKAKIIPSEAKTISSKAFLQANNRNSGFNRIAQFWLAYHRLNVAAAVSVADYHRTVWPEYSIAKLRAAAITKMQLGSVNNEDKTLIELFVSGLSSNIKTKKGDFVQLLHKDLRDLGIHWYLRGRSSVFLVENMSYVDQHPQLGSGYKISLVCSDGQAENNNYDAWQKASKEDKENRFQGSIFSLTEQRSYQDWYLYLRESDVWEDRLTWLLEHHRLGFSWLGTFLAFKNGLLSNKLLSLPENRERTQRELYLFAPELIPPIKNLTQDKLRTNIKFSPDPSQQKAILESLSRPISCIQGPPGTGKSQTIVALIDEFMYRHGKTPRILISAFSHAALEVVAAKILESREGEGIEPNPDLLSPVAKTPVIFSLPSSGATPSFSIEHPDQPKPVFFSKTSGEDKWFADGERIEFRKAGGKINIFERTLDLRGLSADDGYIVFANAHMLYNLTKDKKYYANKLQDGFSFDLIIIDEASQMPSNQLTAMMHFLRPLEVELQGDEELTRFSVLEATPKDQEQKPTHLILVGDQNQLPPIQQVEPPEKLKHLVGSAFSYYLDTHNIQASALSINYRSHPDIVRCIRELGLYQELSAFHPIDSAQKELPEKTSTHPEAWLRQLLDPAQVVSTIIHANQWDSSLSEFEADLTVEIILEFYSLYEIKTAKEEQDFWQKEIGVVAPHNAHGRIIIQKLLFALTKGERVSSVLPPDELMGLLERCIYSVEKFQGSDRSFIIGSVGVSALDQLQTEEEFLYDINRFNVLISRAKHKMLFICSENYLKNVPNNRDVMNVAAAVRKYALELCSEESKLEFAGEQVRMRWIGG